MPETAVHEDRQFEFGENEVRPAEDRLMSPAIRMIPICDGQIAGLASIIFVDPWKRPRLKLLTTIKRRAAPMDDHHGEGITMIHQKPQPVAHDPDETVDLWQLIEDVVPDPQTWKVTPNPVLGGERPIDLMNTARESILRNLLRAAKHGMAS